MQTIPAIFDRPLLALRRARRAEAFAAFDFLKREAAVRLCERLEDFNRVFPLALDVGAHRGELREALQGRGGIEQLIQADYAQAMLRHAQGLRVAMDEEWLPFGDNLFDLVISAGALHWVNDLPGAFAQICRCLKADGLFLVAMPGGGTLQELREVLTEAEIAEEGGISPRISPFMDVRDAGSLLQRAGFALPVVDAEKIEVTYASPMQLLRDLQGMAESNTMLARRPILHRRVIARAMALYAERYSNDDGRVRATFEMITLTAWKPHASQQKPARRGSGQVSLSEALR